MSASRSVRSPPKLTYSDTMRIPFASATSVGKYAVVSETTATRGIFGGAYSQPAVVDWRADARLRRQAGRGPPGRAPAGDSRASGGAAPKRRRHARRAGRLRPAPGRPGDGDLRAGARRDDAPDPRGRGAPGEAGAARPRGWDVRDLCGLRQGDSGCPAPGDARKHPVRGGPAAIRGPAAAARRRLLRALAPAAYAEDARHGRHRVRRVGGRAVAVGTRRRAEAHDKAALASRPPRRPRLRGCGVRRARPPRGPTRHAR